MKIHPILPALGLLVSCMSCERGLLTEQRSVWEVHLDLQVVSVPEELAMPLVDNLRDARRSEGAYKDVQKLLVEKRAILVGWPSVTTKSGQRAVVEQIEEIRYATEYQAAATAIAPSALLVDQAAKPESSKPDAVTFEPFPASFETRNSGVSFEVEPVVAADGEMIELSMVPQDVRLLGWSTATIEKNPPGMKLSVNQPRFQTNKLNTSMTFRNGERRLIGLFKVAEPAGHVEMFILRVDAVKRRIAIEQMPPPPSAPAKAPPAPSGLAPAPPADATSGGHIVPEKREENP